MANDGKRNEYLAVITRIEQLQKEKLGLECKQHELQNRMAVLLAKIELEVGTAKDSHGKALYSNDNLRNAAKTVKISESPECQALMEQIYALRGSVREIVIQYNKLIDTKCLLLVELGLPSQTEKDKYPVL